MMDRLPPLTALRAFDSAGRHLSFSKAAAELHVTPAAISHQIKALEADLGVLLFRRLNRALLLTEAGQRLLPGIRDGFAGLKAAVAKVRADTAIAMLTVSATPAFSGKWLVPRLEHFSAAHPDLDVRISTSMEAVDFARDSVDIAVRYGSGNYRGLRVDKLVEEFVGPLCAPGLAESDKPLRQPSDLCHHTLLHDDSLQFDPAAPDWRMWLKAARVIGVDGSRGTRFSQGDHALAAAIEGAGVLLGRYSLAVRDLAAGRLIAPFPLTIEGTFAYYLVAPEATAELPQIAAFRNWILAEAASDANDSVPSV